jgi:hypothetical protein
MGRGRCLFRGVRRGLHHDRHDSCYHKSDAGCHIVDDRSHKGRDWPLRRGTNIESMQSGVGSWRTRKKGNSSHQDEVGSLKEGTG